MVTVNRISRLETYPIGGLSWDDGWAKLKLNCSYLSDWGIENLAEGLRGVAASVVYEPHYVCKDHRNLFSNFYSKKFNVGSPYTSRLHFFSVPIDKIEDLQASPERFRDHYIGYSVIRPVKERCLGRTVIDPLKLQNIDKRTFYCLRTTFETHIGGRRFKVDGYPYTSQDGDVTVCAHSALWGVCRYLSERYSTYRETYPFDLVKLTETSSGRVYPHRGMTYSDYCTILSEFGTYPIILRLKEHAGDARVNAAEFNNLCTYIESGFPLLASYAGHVVTIIGHTIDYDLVQPGFHNFIDSSSFLKQFVVVDDNFFPYQRLGHRGDPQNYGKRYRKRKYDISSIVTAVCPLPEKVFLLADKARERTLEYCKGYSKMLSATGKPPFVTRLFLTTNPSFKRRKLEAASGGPQFDFLSSFVAQFNLPHFIWVMEVSPLNLYKRGFCTTEIVMDATCGVLEDASIFMRIGDTLIIDGKQNTVSGNPKHFPQYTHNLGER